MDDILSRLSAMMSGSDGGQNPFPPPIAAEENDQEVALLRALSPYLSPARAEKLEEAVRLMGLMKLIPLLREGGIDR